MSRELLARAWPAGAGPGDAPFTIDLDSTICETYGLAKEGARHHGYTGARGYHPLLADSGFYTHSVVAACRRMDVRFSSTIRQHKSLRNLIEAIPEAAWTPVPYWMDGAAAVAETTYRACLRNQEVGWGVDCGQAWWGCR